MSSATPFGFPKGTELLVQLGDIPHYLCTVQESGQCQSPGDTNISPVESTVTSIKTENWVNISGDHRNPENLRSQQLQQGASQSNIDTLALLASVASDSMFGSGSAKAQYTNNMSAYISRSSAQSEALQTLHLMNPNFSYEDSSITSNTVVVSAVGGGQGSPLESSEQQQQQHFTRFAVPSAVNHASYSHPFGVAIMANAELGNYNSPADLYSKRSGSQGYSWGAGNDFSLLPSGHVGESNQKIHVNLLTRGQLSAHDISHFDVGSMTTSSCHEQAPLFANTNATAQVLNMENFQALSNGGHILSLSLSPQQPSVMHQLHSFSVQQSEPTANFINGLANTGSESLSKEAMSLSSQCAGNDVEGSFAIPFRKNMSGAGYHPLLTSTDNRHGNLFSPHHTIGNYGSKYLKPAQELLNEVASIGQGLRGNAFKRSRFSSCGDVLLVKNGNGLESPGKALMSWSGRKEVEPVFTTAVSINGHGNLKSAGETFVQLSAADRQELQEKRAKLVGMRDEVDRRYKQYYHQIQVVATSFESAAGLGAAATYTALALQTISKHFRCLRDAITGQIQATYRAFGEKEISGITRGETSNLCRIDQQLRQQHALRQLGIMQQQAWRPQRGLPEHSVSILRAWLFEHFLHPYPKDADKIILAKRTGLNRNQVSNWFINARVRLWKPMVEEMYLEELKEGGAERVDKLGGRNKDAGKEEERDGMCAESRSSEFSKSFKHAKSCGEIGQGPGDVKGALGYTSDVVQSRVINGLTADPVLRQEKGGIKQGGTGLRPSAENLEYKTKKANMDCAIEVENAGNHPGDGYKEPYDDVTRNHLFEADQSNLTGYGAYQLHALSRYGQENLGGGTGYTANGGVLLTLGLQHCEGVTISGAQPQYAAQGGELHLLTSNQEDDNMGSADYYNVNESSYEILGMQSRKPFAAHMLCHDFVV